MKLEVDRYSVPQYRGGLYHQYEDLGGREGQESLQLGPCSSTPFAGNKTFEALRT